MRAVRFHDYGKSIDKLQVDEIERPEPRADEVLIEVSASSVNPADTYMVEGMYEPPELPWVPGIDFAGEVVEVGDRVGEPDATGRAESFEPGDRVFGTGTAKHVPGGYQEFAAIPTSRVVHLPDGMDPVTAGGVGCAAVTAWLCLVEFADLGISEQCLIHGGSGGVGHTAVQIADEAGAHVIATASPENHERVSELGADVVLDYGREDLAGAIIEASGGGVDVILDHRLDEYLDLDAEVANMQARVMGIGEAEMDPPVGVSASSAPRLKDLSVTFMKMFNTPDLKTPLERIAGMIERDEFTLEVAREYSLEEAGQAHHDVMADSFFGKLLVCP
jgi:NADPH:quinone reductase-like Zn-dependent oxidoreductase